MEQVVQATITAKGRVTVPKVIRDRLRLKPGDRIDFLLDASGELRVAPVRASVKQLKGMVPRPKQPVTLEQMSGGRRSQVRSMSNAAMVLEQIAE